MDNLLSTVFPLSKTIVPVSLPSDPAPKVPSGNYLDRKNSFGKAPPHWEPTEPMYKTTLPPSPKDNIANDPACVKSAKFPNRPFKRNQCYMLYSPQQNMWGPVCGDGGYNANWSRGNRFGVDYEFKKVFNRPTYAIDVPKMKRNNPVFVSNSPYFPYGDFYLRFNKKYKSYPYVDNYVKGKPTWTFPYAVLNKNAGVVVEGFGNRENGKCYSSMYLLWIILIIIIFALMRRFI